VAELPSKPITQLLRAHSRGERGALEKLVPLVYAELRQLAASLMSRERPDHTLQPTALIHEAYLRLVDRDQPEWDSRAHFFGVAARLMRQILVDHARKHQAGKRGAGLPKLPLEEIADRPEERSAELIALHDALEALARIDDRKCRVVDVRYFGGLSAEEAGRLLGISVATVGRELRMAEAWLNQEMSRAAGASRCPP
jgi:RNA polymerase sigma-70 factor, ECF subfamily